METSMISTLQPLFCSRAALVKAQNRMTHYLADYPEMDCQLVLQFGDGAMCPLSGISRDDIEELLAARLAHVEQLIQSVLHDPDTQSITSIDQSL